MRQLCLPGPIGKMAPGRCVDCGKEISAGAKRCQRCNLQSEEFRRKHTETVRSPEYRRRLSASIKAAHARGAYEGVYVGVFQSPTSIEVQVADALNRLGVEHQPQYRPDGYSRIYDELVPPDVLIEVHGDYWHSTKKARKRDAEKAAWAEENGYHLVIIWEHEIQEQGALPLVTERVIPHLADQVSDREGAGRATSAAEVGGDER